MRDLDKFGPSGGGNTLCPICGFIILVLGYGELLSAHKRFYRSFSLLCLIYPLGGAPARLICSGSRVTLKSPSQLQGRSPSRLQLYLLYLRKAGFYPYSARSFLMSCVASSPGVSRLEYSARPIRCLGGH